MTSTPRWFSETKEGHSRWYVERFRGLREEGADLEGEARLLDAVVARGSHVLDAGCGTGRVGIALQERGHDVTGVDVDPVLLEEARRLGPQVRWVEADLAELDLPDRFDAVVCAGNVMVFVAPGSEARVVDRLASHLRPDGVLVLGFRLDGTYGLDALDADLASAGLATEQRFATWDLRPLPDQREYAVTIARAASGR